MSEPQRTCRREASRRAISLVELLVVIAIIGCIVGMSIPAVQRARESARLRQCSNNLKNIGLGLAGFQAAHKTFPAGSEGLNNTEQAWSSRILPFLEQLSISQQINYDLPWDAPGANAAAADNSLPLYVCPSSLTSFPGKQDYGGIIGTGLLPLPAGSGPRDAFGCGTLIVTGPAQPQPVRPAAITDGLSCTMAGGESVDRTDGKAGMWACGRNCFSQNEPSVVIDDIGSLFSWHPAGAQAWFCDGHVRVVKDGIASAVLGALCTRNGAEASVSSVLD